mgnify:CR=1 FL=1
MTENLSQCRIFANISIILLALFSTFLLQAKVQAKEQTAYFNPGKIWRDNNGVHINAHGGGVLHHKGQYYWFGEHKIEGLEGNKAHVGVHVYSSDNLTNWQDAGIALKVSSDPRSDIVKGSIIERPKVIYNQKTGKFVMWFHLELKGQGYKAARTGVAIADKATGPYRFIKSLRPNANTYPLNISEAEKQAVAFLLQGKKLPKTLVSKIENLSELKVFARDFAGGQMARDMTVYVDKDGKAYQIYSSEENRTLHISLLSDDYLSHTGTYIRVHPSGRNEAPAIAYHNGTYYLLTSGLSGWRPNPARQYAAKEIMGPWEKLNNPTIGVNPQNDFGPEKTFGGQSTFLLERQNMPGQFIAMFDMWRPKNAIDGRYIWLPVEFVDGGMRITWQDSWQLSDFE